VRNYENIELIPSGIKVWIGYERIFFANYFYVLAFHGALPVSISYTIIPNAQISLL
jgi:hypothetical protein